MNLDSISVIIPAYRSSESLPPLMAELARVLPTLTDTYEVIIVNDGSPDGGATWRAIQTLSATYSWVHGIHLMRNYGQHNALLCGIRQARHDLIVTMDDDLQHPPTEIPKLLTHLREGNYDVVYGTPAHEQHGLLRDLASQVTKLALQSSMGVDIARKVSAFRVFRTLLRGAFENYSSPYVSIDVLLTWGTTRFSAVVARHEERTIGKSGYTLAKLIRHALNMITGFSTLPLQVASIVGFLLALFGILVLVYVIGRYLLMGAVVQGFAFLASIVAIFSGAQLFALGIMGEYLARIHFRTMDRPVYTIRERTEVHESVQKAHD
ncbi:MAG: glycosyltransferase [Anaerolinea sp.]|nr:glycosyltransferase [Anaerolinea sp.]